MAIASHTFGFFNFGSRVFNKSHPLQKSLIFLPWVVYTINGWLQRIKYVLEFGFVVYLVTLNFCRNWIWRNGIVGEKFFAVFIDFSVSGISKFNCIWCKRGYAEEKFICTMRLLIYWVATFSCLYMEVLLNNIFIRSNRCFAAVNLLYEDNHFNIWCCEISNGSELYAKLLMPDLIFLFFPLIFLFYLLIIAYITCIFAYIHDTCNCFFLISC